MAVSLTSKLLEHFKQKILTLELKPSGGGCFELEVDGSLVHSKLATGEFPVAEQLIAVLENRLSN